MDMCFEKPSEKTVYEYLCDRAVENPQGMLFYGEKGLTYSQALDHVRGFAALLGGAGIGDGDTVCLHAQRNENVSLMLFALLSVGAAVIMEDPHIAPGARSGQSIRGSLWEQEGAWFLSDCSGERELTISAQFYPVCDPHRPAVLIRTSGSEGTEKTVMLSQYNLVNCLTDVAPRGDYRRGDVALGVLPLSHVFGVVLLFGTVILDYGICYPKEVTAAAALEAVRTYGITRMNGVPSFYKQLAQIGHTSELASLRVGFIGGSPCSEQELRELEEKLGMTLLNVYGMTECVSISSCSAGDGISHTVGVGRAYRFTTLRILSDEGDVLGSCEVGEICVKGASVMLGYYGDPLATKSAIDEAGFLHTGDLGYVDEAGILTVTGRKKDIIICNGVNISARRVELALLQIPGVREAAVVALPDPQKGEVSGAMVAADIPARQIMDALGALLPKNTVPEIIRIVEQLPLTHSGKIDKITVRKMLLR